MLYVRRIKPLRFLSGYFICQFYYFPLKYKHMEKIFLYNTLTRKKEEFQPIISGEVGLYTCGPTVYNFAHLGNLRFYLFEDFLKRTLQYDGYQVKHVMNITDVGHLTGDMDMGEDKMEKGAAREGKSAWEIAEFYTEALKKDLRALNIIEPSIWCKATDNIPEQIAMIKTLEEKGFTYKTSDGIYFDTSKVKDYNKLSHLDLETLREGARVEKNEEKKNSTDFALWKFSPAGVKRQMEWESPWGIGFPGWHIECSAMSLKFLGDQTDIHCGGIDHINVHHTNEIAQSEAASGKKFFNYWMHVAFLNIAGGKKMAKSADNFLTLDKVFAENKSNSLAYRLAALQTSYRKPMEYSEEAITSAVSGLSGLYDKIRALGKEIGKVNDDYKKKFLEKINDDLNFPEALAVLHEVLKSDLSSADKLATVLDFDMVLGLNFHEIISHEEEKIPEEILALVEQRKKAREEKNWAESDRLRAEIEAKGYSVKDMVEGMEISNTGFPPSRE
jgi:cysteinyl-tRNA synthetase